MKNKVSAETQNSPSFNGDPVRQTTAGGTSQTAYISL